MKNMTELVFILDRSGSMGGLESDTIGGFNSMLSKQKEEEGDARVTTALFDHNYSLLHDRIDIGGVVPITKKEYFVGGSTALLDAVGTTINKIGNALRETSEEFRSDKVIFVIITDGYENASREYDYTKVKKMIERQKKKYNWEFIFLGANIDAEKVGESFGIHRSRVQRYNPDGFGTALNFCTVGNVLSDYRKHGEFEESWGGEIAHDYETRGNENKKAKK